MNKSTPTTMPSPTLAPAPVVTPVPATTTQVQPSTSQSVFAVTSGLPQSGQYLAFDNGYVQIVSSASAATPVQLIYAKDVNGDVYPTAVQTMSGKFITIQNSATATITNSGGNSVVLTDDFRTLDGGTATGGASLYFQSGNLFLDAQGTYFGLQNGASGIFFNPTSNSPASPIVVSLEQV